MSLLTDRNNFIGHFASTWSGSVPAFFPGEEFEEPQPTGNIASPASYQILEVLYQEAEQLTFGGTRMRRGSIVHNLWVERAGTDQAIITAADSIVTLWASASLTNAILFPKEALLGDPVSDGPWEGRALSIPFWIIE